MKFVEVPGLASVTAALRQLDAGDRIINGRAELFNVTSTTVDKTDTRKVSDQLEKMSPQFSYSPLGSLNEPNTKQLLVTLILTMNQSFPDYDFSRLTPDHFHPMPDIHVVVSTINYNLATFAERTHRGFLAEMWKALRDCIDLNSAEVYSYQPDLDSGPHADALWSFDYFFYDKATKRILYFSCVTVPKRNDEYAADEDMNDASMDIGSGVGSVSGKSEELIVDAFSQGGFSDMSDI
jgi:hypothetical protein